MGDRPIRERRLGLGVDDPQGNVQLLAHPPHERGAVLGLADGRGGDGGDAFHPAPLAVLELVDDLEAGGGIVLRHQQADRVGADVDGRDAIAGGRLGAGPGRRAGAHEPEVAW